MGGGDGEGKDGCGSGQYGDYMFIAQDIMYSVLLSYTRFEFMSHVKFFFYSLIKSGLLCPSLLENPAPLLI